MTNLTLAKPALDDMNDAVSIASTLVRAKLRIRRGEGATFHEVRDSVEEVAALLGVYLDEFAVLQEVARRNSITVRRHGDGVAYAYNH